MEIKFLFKRVVIGLCVVLAAALLIVGSISGYLWIKERPQREEMRRDSEAFLADLTARRNGLLALGEVNLDPSSLTLAELQQKLHQQSMKKDGSQNSTRLGWACGHESCAIWASFLVPFGQEISSNLVPAALVVMSPPFGDFHNVSFGGVQLGAKVEEMEENCRKRGYGRQNAYHQMSWNKDWNVVWGEVNGKVVSLIFLNEVILKKAEAERDRNRSDQVDVHKEAAK
jgi:hypothetical protein